MWELYLLTRLESIHALFCVFLVFSVVALMLAAGLFYIDNNVKHSKLITLIGSITIVISIIGIVFIPTTKDTLLILGVGKSIDYLISNETAKQLPDKCIEALNVWVDSFTEENKRKESN